MKLKDLLITALISVVGTICIVIVFYLLLAAGQSFVDYLTYKPFDLQ